MTAAIALGTIAGLQAAPNIGALLEEYAAEAANRSLPPPAARLPLYHVLEDSGQLAVITAHVGGELAGFVTVLASGLPHYDAITVAVTESYFVAARHRASGAGLQLLAEAEHVAAGMGAKVLLVSAPIGGRLEEILPRRGYREANRVFCKEVADA